MIKQNNPPPIQYLFAFRAAAQLGSFVKAAEALNVTPSAVSQQIKTLETNLGITLFERANRAIHLTNAGEGFMEMAQATLKTYESGFSNFLAKYGSSGLRITMPPFIATEVIIPNLLEFSELHPSIELIIETSFNIVDLASSHLDGAIRFGVPPWDDNQVQMISSVEANIVASDTYLKEHPITFPEFFGNQTILHTRSNINDWDRLRNDFGFTGNPARELYFDSYTATVKAAEEGLGLAFGLFPVINRKVAEGTLKTVSLQNFPIEQAYYLVTKPNERKQESIDRIYQWLTRAFEKLDLTH